MKKRLFLSVLASLLVLPLLLGQAHAEIRIGLMAPLTGSWASEGQAMKQIVDLLAEEQNNAGGVLGQKVVIVAEDDAGDPRTAALAAQRLSTRNIVAVIGTYGSSITEASQNIFDENKIVQVATGSTAIRLSEKGMRYFFRTSPRDDEQGLVAANTLKDMGFTKVAILHDNTTYAKGLADEAQALLKEGNVEIVFFNALTPGERDYSAILSQLRARAPEVVLFTGYFPEAGLLLRQKKAMGWDVPFIGGDATNNPDLVSIAGKEAAEGFMFLSPPVPQDLDSPEATSFMNAYRARYQDDPASVWAVLAGDAFKVIVAAIEGTESTDPDKIAEYLKTELDNFQGLTGTIAFDEKGDRVGELYRVYKVDGEGRFILQQ
ncbi:amino acid/amide ABC transporter substrate-binding protein, HAAT family [Desulfonatronum thiosulfatophilum]|uniref:Amino acid/amide ABC transporter substrate-binding protein, HAAT family n=1 Tax=Desulfonatronum thiosulfatophilum TaxID=617002 RepID=A0A1G6E202_9BACT|nr:branched-chain amino acid ABC transporter substrate-binding protein [Desulfonatronum thiosulfatophilum]SDB51477.1 amino acid/amide ABC transporter substrate-binding protein, HAAT family [Desulfonatronum thiosulfatophilum]